MMSLLVAAMFALWILTALYAFGFFSTPYSDAFRFAFYVIILVFAGMMVYAMGDHPFEGYDPTPDGPR
jgi:Na+/proline symporter